MIAYKVVTIDDDGRLLSAIVTNPDLAIEYHLGIWIYPKLEGSRLLVFSTFEDADIFNHYTQAKIRSAILECQVLGPLLAITRLAHSDAIDHRNFGTKCAQEFWAKAIVYSTFITSNYDLSQAPPDGTMATPGLKPIRIIER